MGNANTSLSANYTSSGGFPGVSVGASSTAEAELKDGRGNSARIQVPAGYTKNKLVKVRAYGRIVIDSGTITLVIGKGSDISATPMATTGALTTAVDGAFLFETEFLATAQEDVARGSIQGFVSDQFIARAANSVAAWDPDVANTINITAQFSASDADHSVVLYGFDLEVE